MANEILARVAELEKEVDDCETLEEKIVLEEKIRDLKRKRAQEMLKFGGDAMKSAGLNAVFLATCVGIAVAL